MPTTIVRPPRRHAQHVRPVRRVAPMTPVIASIRPVPGSRIKAAPIPKRKAAVALKSKETKGDAGAKFSDQTKGGERELSSQSHRIHTLEELLAYTQVDLKVWEVRDYVVNKWEMGAKHPTTGEIITEPLFQVKAWLKPRGKARQVEEMIEDLLADVKKHAPRYPKLTYKQDKKKTDGHLCVYAIPDLHLGKLCHKDETGSNYDCKIARELFLEAVEELASRTRGFQVERILFVAGNDFFNVDNAARTTTGGTPQDEDGRWQKTFKLGRELLVEAIDKLSVIAPVDVVVVPGNHDSERMHYLGEVLSAWYNRNPQVKIYNEPTQRKYYEFGRVLLGLTHGDKEKMKELPLIMATEQPLAWARTEYRELMLGHFHKKQQLEVGAIDEFRGVRVRRLSSLTAPDAWHHRQGYAALRSAEALVYHPQDGCVGTFAYNLRAEREARFSK